jgi:hypothetical protein
MCIRDSDVYDIANDAIYVYASEVLLHSVPATAHIIHWWGNAENEGYEIQYRHVTYY